MFNMLTLLYALNTYLTVADLGFFLKAGATVGPQFTEGGRV